MSNGPRTCLGPQVCAILPSASVILPYARDDKRYGIGDNRCTINDNTHPIDDKGIDDNPYTDERYGIYDKYARKWFEKDLKAQYRVAFLRTPREEALIIDNASYLGMFPIIYQMRPGSYNAHIWLVDFHRIEGRDLERPIRGLLQIKSSTWTNSGLGEPRFALQGRCKIIDSRTDTLRIEHLGPEVIR
jgi:hypothetical protein